ncbi:MAG: hypothetical protein QOE36_2271, partial [Gaiellaceae bacterium]|nr:hypothetical protein [Gaiellaceae bacterium]
MPTAASAVADRRLRTGHTLRNRVGNRLVRSRRPASVLVLALLLAAGLSPLGPAAHHAPPPSASGDPDASAPPATGTESELRARDAWFYHQRAGLDGTIPPGALLRAREATRALRQRSASLAATSPRLIPALPWTPIGPHPIRGTDHYYMGTPPLAGRVTAIAPDPTDLHTAYLGGAAGGVWKTTDDGVHWTPLSDGQMAMAIGSIAVAPTNHQVVYVGTGEANTSGDSYTGDGVYRSADGGAHWTRVGADTFGTATTGRCAVADVVVSPADANVVLAAPQGGSCGGDVLRSTDGGATWSKALLLPGGRATDLAVDPNNPAVWYAAVAHWNSASGVWKSTDGGATWAQLGGGLPQSGTGIGRIVVAPTSSQRLYAAFSDTASLPDPTPQLWTSADAGATWTQLTLDASFCNVGAGSQCWYDLALAVSPADPSSFFAAGIKLFKYGAAGASSSLVGYGGSGIHVDFHALAFDAAGRLWVGSDGGVYRSDDGGASFASLNADLSIAE